MGRFDSRDFGNDRPFVVKSRGGKLLFFGLTVCGIMYIINWIAIGLTYLLRGF